MCLTDVHPRKGEDASGIRHRVLSCWSSAVKQVVRGMEESKAGSQENVSPTMRIEHNGDLSEEPTKMLHKKASIWMLLLEGTAGKERQASLCD